MITVESSWIPKGQAYFEDAMSAAVQLTDTPNGGDALPAGVNCALIYVTGQPIYWKNDGDGADSGDPKYPKDSWMVITNSRDTLVNSSFLETAASARLDCWWFQSPSG